MRALTWQATGKVSVEEVPDPRIEDAADAIIRVTSTAICGSDLHLYNLLGPFLSKGDILGHEPMGIVEEIGSAVTTLAVGDRVVIPFVIACGECYMCRRGLTTQCETTQNREHRDRCRRSTDTPSCTAQVPGGQAEYLRVRRADPMRTRSDTTCPTIATCSSATSCRPPGRACSTRTCPTAGRSRVLGLGPVGQFVSRIGRHLGYRVFAVDPVPERRTMAERHGIEVYDLVDDRRRPASRRDRRARPRRRGRRRGNGGARQSGSRVRAEGGGAPARRRREAADDQRRRRPARGAPPRIDLVQRGGTVSLSGVYAGAADPMPIHDDVRQAGLASHGPVQRAPLARRPAADRRGSGTTRSASRTSSPTGSRSIGRPRCTRPS